MPCILAPTTFSYILNAKVLQQPNQIKRAHHSSAFWCNRLLLNSGKY